MANIWCPIGSKSINLLVYQAKQRSFEKLPIPVVQILTGILNKYRGDFLKAISSTVSILASEFLQESAADRRFRFEEADSKLLKEERHDSPKLLDLCRVGDVQPNSP